MSLAPALLLVIFFFVSLDHHGKAPDLTACSASPLPILKHPDPRSSRAPDTLDLLSHPLSFKVAEPSSAELHFPGRMGPWVGGTSLVHGRRGWAGHGEGCGGEDRPRERAMAPWRLEQVGFSLQLFISPCLQSSQAVLSVSFIPGCHRRVRTKGCKWLSARLAEQVQSRRDGAVLPTKPGVWRRCLVNHCLLFPVHS